MRAWLLLAAAIPLLSQNAELKNDPDGTTPLMWAVHNNDLQQAGKLIREGANVAAKNDYGATAMSEAAIIANPAMLELLLKSGADVNAPGADGQTPLMVVARTGKVEAARLLIGHGANVNAKESYHGQTALMWAVDEGQPGMVKELIAHGAELNARSTVNNWERDVTAEPRRKYMPRGGWTPLLFAARQGCLECARILVGAGADKNLQDPDGVSPMITAIVNGHYDVAAYLIEQGADVNLPDHWGRSALWAAVDMHTMPHSGRPDVVEPDSVSSTDLLKLVLAHTADVNVQLALFPPYRSLADRGSDNILTIGATPLLRAAKAGDTEAIRWLLAKGADPNLATDTGVTPLMAAAGLGSRDSDTRGRFKTESEAIESCKILLAAGAKINAVDGRGQTALHGAAFWGDNQLVQFLADHGAKLDAKDARGMTPIDSAMGRAGGNGFGGNRIDVHKDTAELLKKLMAAAGTASGSK
ncbi:MAG TPA: ankyrin repeat domain-containing protein [Bryobacteraceae bacterium]|nr:ankyrin repeat domain-containing protein [Bryobacteraceae bacterium]